MILSQKYSRPAFLLTGAAITATLFYRIPAINSWLTEICFFWHPLFWCGLSVILWYLPRPHLPAPLRFRDLFPGLAISCMAVYTFLQFLAGFLLNEIAVSPYDLSPKGILINFANLLPPIAGSELLRAYCIGASCRSSGRPAFRIVLGAFILGAMEIPFTNITTLHGGEDWFIFLAEDLLPPLAQSGFLSLFTYCGGVWPGILYRGLISIFFHVIPFLPSLPWIGNSVLGIAFPVLASFFIWDQYGIATHRARWEKPQSILSTTILMTVCIALAWFVVGVFPVYPSVILTGSMEPEISPGDVVLVEKMKTEKNIDALSKNDIIHFRRGDITITHRITQVLHDKDGNLSFRTKGDSNDDEDTETVEPNDVKGIVNHAIPKIGMPVLWLKGHESTPEGVIDNETP